MNNNYVTYVPAPVPEIWNIHHSSLGSVLTGQKIERFAASSNNVTLFTLISGTTPPGINFYANGKITGTALVTHTSSVIPQHTSNFAIQIDYADNTSSIVNYNMNIVDRAMITEYVATQSVANDPDSYSFKIDVESSAANTTWHLVHGQLPPRMELDQHGNLLYKFESVVLNNGFRMDSTYLKYKTILPFIRENFTATAPSIESILPSAWNKWLKSFIATSQEFDYQFVLEQRDNNGNVLCGHTFRVIHLKPPRAAEFFFVNRGHLTYDPEQIYYILVTTLPNDIKWNTTSNLGTVVNGSLSSLSVLAESKQPLEYIPQPYLYNRFPQGVQLLTSGEISGRFSFRCYQDDPATVPLNDIYNFNIRARTKDFNTYAERRFTLKVSRQFNKPLDQLYVRAFPSLEYREKINTLLTDSTIFEPRSLYRPNDPWYGLNTELKFLFATGLNPISHGEYEQLVSNNHTTKRVYFGSLSMAVAHNLDFQTIYEVIYLPIIDETVQANRFTTPSSTIDLRPYIKNYYVKNNQSYYILQPSGLEQMSQIIQNSLGENIYGMLPLWMTSLQPSSVQGRFTSPLGFIYAVPLVFVKPGFGKRILYRLREFNFNSIPFEFDRYILDNVFSKKYNTTNNTYQSGGNITIFDNGSTILDSNSTKLLENLEYYYNPGQSNKYIKFPKTGAFI